MFFNLTDIAMVRSSIIYNKLCPILLFLEFKIAISESLHDLFTSGSGVLVRYYQSDQTKIWSRCTNDFNLHLLDCQQTR